MRLFTKFTFVNQKTRFTNAALVNNRICKCDLRMRLFTKVAFVNLKPLKPQLIQKNIRMRLFQITAFVNRIYKCGSIAAFVFLLFTTAC